MTRSLTPFGRRRRRLLGMLPLAAAACATVEPADDPPPAADDDTGRPPTVGDDPGLASSEWARASGVAVAPADATWAHHRFRGRTPTAYHAGAHDGRPALHAVSRAGNSAVRLVMPPTPLPTPARLRFSWWLPALNERADLRDADIDDACVRVLLSFAGDRARWAARDHLLSELAAALTGEPLPEATLIYVWDPRAAVGSVIDNPHTRRIRHLVVQSGPAALGRWVDHARDVHADFAAVFGEPMPRLQGVAVMSDANNTGASVQAWFGPVRLDA